MCDIWRIVCIEKYVAKNVGIATKTNTEKWNAIWIEKNLNIQTVFVKNLVEVRAHLRMGSLFL